MKQVEFQSVVTDHNIYDGLVHDGLLESVEYVKDLNRLYIVGIDITYADTEFVPYHGWYKYTLMVANEHKIINMYRNEFGEVKLKKRICQHTSLGNLLLEILGKEYVQIDGICTRINILSKYGEKNIKSLDMNSVRKLLNHTLIKFK